MLTTLINALIKPNYLTLEDVGYVSVVPEFFDDIYLYCIGMSKSKNSDFSYKIFKKEIEKEFKDCLFINKETIVHMIFIDDLMVYRKVYDSKQLSIGQQYMSVVKLLPEFNNQLANYKEMNRKALREISLYIDRIKVFINGSSSYLINSDKNFKDTYHLSFDGNGKLPDTFKIIGNQLYRVEDARIKPLEFNFKNSGIDFEESYIFWLSTVSDNESLRKKCIMELNFNNKAFFYLKATDYDQGDPKINMILFKNLSDADMLEISLPELMSDTVNFQKILMLKAAPARKDFEGIYTLVKRHVFENKIIHKWWVSEMCKECVSLNTREKLGFTLKGPLTNDELLVIEAIFI